MIMKVSLCFRRSLLVLVVLLALAGGGCATSMKIPQYGYDPSSKSQLTKESGGLRVVVDPFFDRERSKTYFGVNAAENGLAILFLRLENVGSVPTYLVRKEGIRLRTATS